MYNRYTPQADGSYRRDKIPDRVVQPTPVQQHRPQITPPSPPPQPLCPPDETPTPCPPPEAPPCLPPTAEKQPGGIPSFLRKLLPVNFDTGDLMILLLLLLMAGDNEEEKGTALLTLAFYLFM